MRPSFPSQWFRLIFWSAVFVFAGTVVGAQERAALTGRVTVPGGVGLSDVAITIHNVAAGIDRTITTQPDGSYLIPDLPVEGVYDVRAELTGFAPVARIGILLAANQRATVDFVMYAASEESLVVTGRLPALEQDQVTVQSLVSERMAHTLPLIGRDFISLASLAPGFSGNPNYPSPNGQIYWSNNVLVDGASHYSKWRGAARTFYSGYSLEAIRDVQVLTTQFSAEYGEALAAVTAAVTNSGTNELHGSALVFVQDDVLNSVPVFSFTEPPSSTQRYGATAGGPLVKDRTHYFATYEGRRSRLNNVVVSPLLLGALVPDNEDEHLLFGKVDHKRTDTAVLTASYNGQWFRWHHEPGGLSLPGTGVKYRNDVSTVLLSDAWILSARAVNQWRFQFARYTDDRRDLQPSLYISRAGYSVQGGTLGPYGFGAAPEDTWEGADTLSLKKAAHSLKAGGELKYVRSQNASLPYGWGAYFFGGSPALFPQPFAFVQGLSPSEAVATADPRSVSLFAFLQDDWKIASQFTLNAGVRYDVESIRNVRNYNVGADTDNIQPRVGFAWQPTSDANLIVRGGVGVYTQQHLLYEINKVQLEGSDGTATLSLAPGSPLMPAFPTVLTGSAASLLPRDVQVVDPGFRNPYSVQWTVGVQRPFMGVRLSADAISLRGHDLMSLIDLNAPASVVKPNQRTVAQADATRPTPPVANGFRKVLSLGNLGDSWYRGLQIKADRTTGSLLTETAYTISRAQDEDNYFLPEDSRNLQAEKGRADNDIRHNLSVGFIWQVPAVRPWLREWSLSGLSQFRSNRPYTITWGDDRNGTSQNDARPGARNTGKTDAYMNIDVALIKRLRIANRIIEARAEAFNVLNATNFDEYVGTLSSPLFGHPVTAFPRRRIQLAAIVRY